MKASTQAALAAIICMAALATSYGLALAGEPQSSWLWGDVLGVVQ